MQTSSVVVYNTAQEVILAFESKVTRLEREREAAPSSGQLQRRLRAVQVLLIRMVLFSTAHSVQTENEDLRAAATRAAAAVAERESEG